MADLYETMSTLRAVRRLRPDPIPNDVMERLLQAACWAPTGGNQQPWMVVVVTDPDRKLALKEIYEPQWQKYVGDYQARLEAMDGEEAAAKLRALAAGDRLAAHLHDAPAILMFCGDPSRMAITDSHLERVSMIGGASVYPPVQNLMLACVAEGIGCTLTTLHCRDEEAVKAALDIPDQWATVAMVPIGYPVGKGHGPITRRPVADMVYRDSWGTAW